MDIDLNIIKKNVLDVKKIIGKSKFCAVIKANAYGHGINEIFDFLCPFVDMFAVSSIDEAQSIKNNHAKDILILSGITSKLEADIATKNNFIVTLKDVNDLNFINNNTRAHIKIDTGMNRLGVKTIDDFYTLYNANYRLEGIFSHFYSDNDVQYARFIDYIKRIDTNKLLLHIASSGSYYKYPMDMCRIGIQMYSNCQKIYGKIVQIKDVANHEIVSYGGKYICNQPQKIAVVRIGYGDGFLRKYGQTLIINDKPYSVIGNICMDMCMIVCDDKVHVGDNAYYIADNIKDVAKLYDTIDYQVLTLISERVKRNYVFG